MTRLLALLLLALAALPARAEPPQTYTVTLTAEQLGYIAQWLRGDLQVAAPPWNKAAPIITSLGAQVDKQLADRAALEKPRPAEPEKSNP